MKPSQFFGALAAILILYPLSLGPAQWLFTHNILSIHTPVSQAICIFYQPLRYVSAVPPLYHALDWYVHAVSGESLD